MIFHVTIKKKTKKNPQTFKVPDGWIFDASEAESQFKYLISPYQVPDGWIFDASEAESQFR
jgi:hypothetical protein